MALSPGQERVLFSIGDLIGEGVKATDMTNELIAQRCGIDKDTVKAHKTAIYKFFKIDFLLGYPANTRDKDKMAYLVYHLTALVKAGEQPGETGGIRSYIDLVNITEELEQSPQIQEAFRRERDTNRFFAINERIQDLENRVSKLEKKLARKKH